MTWRTRIRNAWLGGVSGCMVGKPVEILSMSEGHEAVSDYLLEAGVEERRDYVPLGPGTTVARLFPETCRGRITCAIPDDDINYTVLALMLIEQHGIDFTMEDVGRTWLRLLPGGMTFTAEREAYVRLLADAGTGLAFGAPPAFDMQASRTVVRASTGLSSSPPRAATPTATGRPSAPFGVSPGGRFPRTGPNPGPAGCRPASPEWASSDWMNLSGARLP